MGNVTVLEHPLIQHKLSMLRDKTTNVKEFRELVREMAMLMTYEATRDLPLCEIEVETPLTMAKTRVISGKKLAVVPVLRAGLGMLDGVLELIPAAKVGHLGMYRNEATLEPVSYYCKMPEDIAQREVLVLDPMLATGGTLCAALQIIKDYRVNRITLMTILSSTVGVEEVQRRHPDVDVYTCAVDPSLNEHGYIVPGLGDAGDRLFGTK